MPLYVLPCPNLSKGQSCTPCEDLTIINQELFEAEKLVATLKSKRRSVCERMNRAHDPLTSKLPAEVISKIFTILLPGNLHGQYNINFTLPQTVQWPLSPFLLGAVCGFWRAVAWSTPQLWTSISVGLSNMNTTLLSLLHECLLRSGQLPLYMRLQGPPIDSKIAQGISNQFFEEVNFHSERWFDLDLRLSTTFLSLLHSDSTNDLMLNTLSISSTYYSTLSIDINLGRIPNLRNLDMHPLQVDGLNLSWKTLTNVNIVSQSVDMCFDLFSEASSITHCSLVLNTNKSRTTRNTFLRHDHLIFLNISCDTKSSALTNVFFLYMELPALNHLVITACDDIDPVCLQHLLSRCSLKIFKMNVDLVNSDLDYCARKIIPILDAIPSLETLEFNGSYPEVSVDPLLIRLSQTTVMLENSASQDTMFLPNLRNLHIKRMIMSWPYVSDVVFTHSENDPTTITPTSAKFRKSERRQYIRPLLSLHIQVRKPQYRHPLKYIELEIAQNIQRAVEHGFDVEIACRHFLPSPHLANFVEESIRHAQDLIPSIDIT